MKQIVLFYFLLAANFSNAQIEFKNDSIKSFIDKSFDIISENSINKNDVNLIAIKNNLYEKTSQLSHLDELPPYYTDVFKALNDHHGALKFKEKTIGWSIKLQGENNVVKGLIKTDNKVHSEILKTKYAYVRIPGNNDFAFKKVDSISSDIACHINAVNSSKIKGWIIDLRTNTGGNMYPILLGLKGFLGNNTLIGGFRNAKNENTGNWEIKNNELYIDDNLLKSTFTINSAIPDGIPIVVLTSYYTASAGEMTVITFKGRKNTYFAGEPTANYTTAVIGFKINSFSGINLSTDYVVDRNSNVYKSYVKSDFEIINQDNFNDLKNDAKVIKAIQLIRN